jgi:hypothetical protein
VFARQAAKFVQISGGVGAGQPRVDFGKTGLETLEAPSH